MPPRYAYWTILVDGQPTAFRSGSQEELLPTFKRLKAKSDTAVMMWFQNGKLWPSRIDAQEAMRARGEMGRRGDERQAGFRSRNGGFSARAPEGKRDSKIEWKPKGAFRPAPKRSDRPDWKPKPDDRAPRPDRSTRPDRAAKPEWKPKATFSPEPRRSERPAWKPKGSFDRERPSGFDGPRARRPFGKPDWTPEHSDRPAWKPKGASPAGAPEKRKWVPKEEYKKSMGIEARRDKNWRPGGEHKDPRQKYKDAKKAKWSRFKQDIRARSGGKGKKSS